MQRLFFVALSLFAAWQAFDGARDAIEAPLWAGVNWAGVAILAANGIFFVVLLALAVTNRLDGWRPRS
jgi:hypothetical protein